MKSTALALTTALLTASAANATTLDVTMNVDDEFIAYLGTESAIPGAVFATGSGWSTTHSISTELVDGVTNYLYIQATNSGSGPAGLLGEFTLSDSDFVFENGLQTMLSGDAGIHVSETGWVLDYTGTTSYGANGSNGTWALMADIPTAADWVWSDAWTDTTVYFKVALDYVAPIPVPAGLPLALTALGALGFVARKRRKA